MRERFIRVVADLLDRDEKTVVVLAVISHALFADSGVEARHPSRIIDVGIREQAQLGITAGLALSGYKPIATGYAPFLIERAFEQIKLDFAHQGVSAILASVGGSWDSSGSGRTHQAPEDVALMSSLRSWSVHVPGHPDEMEELLLDAHARGERAYIRMTSDSNRTRLSDRPSSVEVVRRGSVGSPTVLAVGPVADAVLEGSTGLDVTVAYTATPYPVDSHGLADAVTGPDVLIVEPYLEGTSIGAVVEALPGRALRVSAHGVRDVDIRRYGTPEEHRGAHGLDSVGVRSLLIDLYG